MDTTSTHESTQVRWSAAWRLDTENPDAPVLNGGVDHRLQLHGLDAGSRAALDRWSREIGPIHVRADQRRLADRLIDLGVLAAKPTSPALCFVGDEAFTTKLAASMEAQADVDGLALVIRTGDQWPTPPLGPHLAIDVAMHHTLVLGPYVVPGLSACTSCLDTRVARRWTATPAAPEPAIQQNLHVIGELVRIQVDLIDRHASPLVNATITWDLEQGTTRRDALLKSPGCATCDTAVTSGRLALPWTSEASS